MPINSREKGARLERAASKRIAVEWCAPDCMRQSQNGVKGAPDLGAALPNARTEVKGRHKIAAARWMDQCVDEARPGEVPVVVMREDRGEWLVMLRLSDSQAFAERLATNLGRPIYPAAREDGA